MKKHLLHDACSSGGLDPEEWTEPLIDMVASDASNQDLLIACEFSSRGLDESSRVHWMDNLLEFSLWETGSKPWRLELCDHLLREGKARFDSPKRWASFGGLLHVACEAGSFEAIEWAIERDPRGALRLGGVHGMSPLHALAMHEKEEVQIPAIELLISRGADPDLRTRDGRNCLFRCASPAAASLLMSRGADPWALDSEGHNPVGFWLELGMWRCAIPALSSRPQALREPQPWGSMGRLYKTKPEPLLDLPLFILGCAVSLRGEEGEIERGMGMRALIELGADPLALDSRGRSLHERSASPVAFALMEARALELHAEADTGREGSRGRL